MYIAVSYIGNKYTPGEILPDNLPDDQVKWLLEAGAIRSATPAPAPAAMEEPEGDEEEDAPNTEEPEGGEEDDASNSEELEDEIDDDAQAPEINVMDGVVAPQVSEKPKKGKTQSAAKPAGRRKAK